MKHKLIIACFLFFVTNFYAQYQLIGASYYEGKNVNFLTDREFGRTQPQGAELSWSRKRTPIKKWEKIYKGPTLGWKFNWVNHRNVFLGQSFAISRFIEITLKQYKSLELKLGASHGLMYATQIYNGSDALLGTYNNAISERINIAASLGLGFYKHFNKRVSFGIYSFLSHFSNGSISQPNDGLNIWNFGGRLQYRYTDKEAKVNEAPQEGRVDKRIKLNINFGAGVNQREPGDRTKYPLYTTMLYLDKYVTEINKIGFGFDVYVNTGIQHEANNDPIYKGADYKRIGFSVAHELMIEKLGIITGIGYHFYSPYPVNMFYQKYGLRYFFTEKFFIAANLKIRNFSVSDELSWGIGVRL